MSCANKVWVSLIGLTSYTNYLPLLVAKQFEEVQYMPRTLGLAGYTGLFKKANSLVELDAIRSD